MTRVLKLLLSILGLSAGCSTSGVLTPAQFTKQFADALRKSAPAMKVEVIRDLEIKLTNANGGDATSFLDNAYTEYQSDPRAKDDVIQRFVAAAVETVTGLRDVVDRTRIVPVIKDRPWLGEIRQALLSRGAKEIPQHVYEDFSPDLVIVYAEDSPKNIRYLTAQDLKDANIERKELRELACGNLKRLLPKIERRGANGLYMVTAGGDYEASLLLLDSIWSGGTMDVNGDIVVAIPSRDVLLVTGSQDQEGLDRLKQIVGENFDQSSYRLTRKLFVYRDGKFNEFGNSAASPSQPDGG